MSRVTFFLVSVIVLFIYGCGGGGSSSSVTATGEFITDGQIIVPTGTNAPNSLHSISRDISGEYLTDAKVTYNEITTTTDSKGMFHLESSSQQLGTHLLKIEKGNITLNYPVTATDKEQIILKLQYNGSIKKNVVTETHLDFSNSGKIGIQTLVKLYDPLSTSFITQTVSSSGNTDILDNSTLTELNNKIKTLIKETEDEAKKNETLTGVVFSTDDENILDNSKIKIKPLIKSITLISPYNTLVKDIPSSINLKGTYSDNSDSAIISDITYTSSNSSVLTVDNSGKIDPIDSGDSIVEANYKELTSSVKLKVILNPITNLYVSNISSKFVNISFITSWPCKATLNYGKTASLGLSSKEETFSQIHTFNIDNLETFQKYYYEIFLEGSYSVNIKNGSSSFEFKTAQTPQTATNSTLGLKVIDPSGNIIEGAFVYIYTDLSFPLMVRSDKNGIATFSLANLKNKTDGNNLTVKAGDIIKIDIITANSYLKEKSYTLTGDTPYNAGEFTLTK